MKTVDKFGRYRGFQNRIGPPGVGFHLTADGQYDMQNKILRRVGNPRGGTDAINGNYLQKIMEALPTPDANKKEYDCRYFRLANVGTPATINDAANVQAVHDAIIAHEYWLQREMADLVVFLRREIYNVHRDERLVVQKHMAKIDKKLGRTWREVLNLKTVAERLTKEEKEDIRRKQEVWDHFPNSNLVIPSK